MLSVTFRYPRLPLATVSLVGVSACLLLTACGEGPTAMPAPVGDEQPPNSVGKMSAPSAYKNSLTNKLNNYRAQTYGTRMDVAHSDVLYTAAFRHAKNINSVNSAGVSTRPLPGADPGIEQQTITPDSSLTDLEEDSAPGTTDQFPVMFTSVNRYNRVRAVVGGDSLIFTGGVGRVVFENYDFNGNITAIDGLNSEFRGFSLEQRLNASQAVTGDNDFRYDPVDTLWYSRRGRHALIQPTMKKWAYASVLDDSIGTPPYPILSGRFLGSTLAVADRPLTQQLGVWPNNGNTDVTPYGLDTDLSEILQEDGGDSAYGGPPIHITLPAAEPFLKITLSFTDLDGYPNSWPKRWRKLAIYSNQDPDYMRTSVLTVSIPGVSTAPGYIAGEDVGEVKLETTEDEATNLRDGELYIQTLGPLVPNHRYQVNYSIRTAQGRTLAQTIVFTTNLNSSFSP